VAIEHRREGNVAVVTARGRYSMAELRDGIDEALDAFGDEVSAGLLFDLTASESLGDRTADDLRAMAIFLASRGSRFSSRLAMVALTDVAYGLMRMGAVTAESHGIAAHVFRDYGSARRWLVPG
jgi:hypothetical protein